MNSQAGWYWVAVGVFALGLTNYMAKDGNLRAENYANRAVETAKCVSRRIVQRIEPILTSVLDRQISEDQAVISVAKLQKVECPEAKFVRHVEVIPPMKPIHIQIVKLAPMPKPPVIKFKQVGKFKFDFKLQPTEFHAATNHDAI
jgi:hypothetical protein